LLGGLFKKLFEKGREGTLSEKKFISSPAYKREEKNPTQESSFFVTQHTQQPKRTREEKIASPSSVPSEKRESGECFNL